MKQQHILQPKLRFPEFEGDWNETKLKEITSLITKGTTPKSFYNQGINFVKLESLDGFNIDKRKFVYIDSETHENELKRSQLKVNDILFAIAGATVGKVAYVKQEILPANTNQALAIIRLKENVNHNYILQILSSRQMKNYIYMNMSVGAQPNISLEQLNNFYYKSPSLPEQQKIADYLSTVDNKINLLEEKKAQLALYKKAMMQKLFSQEIRFKDNNGNDFPDWESFQLKDILLEHKEKNKGYKYTEVVSVAKEKGVINQIEHLGRSYSAENIEHYKVVNPFDVVYTKSPTSGFPFGIIKQNKLNRSAVLSPLYAVFKPKTIYLGMLLHDLFLSEVETFNYLIPLVQKGAKNTMNINNEDFLNGKKYKLPTSEKEQQKIANFLSAIDENIEKVNEQITQTQSFKKAMLQQMFV
ncbi:restriction endonuclease subunit S [Paenimyroides tangerinum]|uniref:Restriction endonuclease subunit S n=1 Tax=Paenimyroides tangerinum TaxID=2488728 RepID=A0A3P3VW40_9FLAO|nr:restriction endonuclease subunit S [Paenimyroides tangerinum]RRJ86664.1 restriction endonuclease subunit S [Paenimyroides tangerinum]